MEQLVLTVLTATNVSVRQDLLVMTVKLILMNAPLVHAKTTEVAQIRPMAISAFVQEGFTEMTVNLKSTSVPQNHAKITPPALMELANISVSASKDLMEFRASKTLMNVALGRAPTMLHV